MTQQSREPGSGAIRHWATDARGQGVQGPKGTPFKILTLTRSRAVPHASWPTSMD